MFSKEAFDFLERYLNNPSPTGFELRGQKLWLDYISPFIDEHFKDNYYNHAAVINPGHEQKVMIEAHADEVSWLINHIDDNGFAHVIKNGGADFVVAPAKHVNIHTTKGIVKGIFGWPASHVRKDIPETKSIDLKNIFIDCGVSSKESLEKLGVQVGDVVTFADTMSVLNETFLVARAIDNRIGGFILAEVARKLKESGQRLDYSLYIVNTVQEEVGLNGARMMAERIKPDYAIVTDVTHDTTTPYIDQKEHGMASAGSGPVLTIAPTLHKGFVNFIEDIAKEKKIPYQKKAESRKSGTDSDAIALINGGICTALISPPIRYMHTPVEMAHLEDIKNVIELMFQTLIRIKPKDLSFLEKISEYKRPSLLENEATEKLKK